MFNVQNVNLKKYIQVHAFYTSGSLMFLIMCISKQNYKKQISEHLNAFFNLKKMTFLDFLRKAV